MAIPDLIIAGLLGYGAWRGWQQGFIVVFINTVALVVAVLVSLKFLHQTTQWLGSSTKQPQVVLPILAFGLLFTLTFFGLKWLATFTSKSIKMTLLGSADRFAGALFSCLKMAFILSSILFALKMTGVQWSILQGEKMVLMPAIIDLGPSCFHLIAPLLPFIKKWLSNT